MSLIPEMDMRVNKGIYADETEALAGVLGRIVTALDPVEVWLFGSRANGTHRPDSDFDLLVVLSDGSLGTEDYERAFAPVLETLVGCDVVPCSVATFAAERRSPTGLVREIVDRGRCLHVKQEARVAA